MVISHWCKLVEGLQVSPLDFYKSLEEALDRRQIPGLKRKRVFWPEGGVLSAKREYLRLTRKKFLFDICAAPFGSGFFVSSRLVQHRTPWFLIILIFLFAGFLALLVLCTLAYLSAVHERDPAKVGTHALDAMAADAMLISMYLLMAAVICTFFLIRMTLDRSVDAWLVRHPLLYMLYQRLTGHTTYYNIDTTLMVEAAVRGALLETVDHYTEAQHLTPLSELERKPTFSPLLMR